MSELIHYYMAEFNRTGNHMTSTAFKCEFKFGKIKLSNDIFASNCLLVKARQTTRRFLLDVAFSMQNSYVTFLNPKTHLMLAILN